MIDTAQEQPEASNKRDRDMVDGLEEEDEITNKVIN